MRTAVLSKSDRAAKKYKVRVGNKTIHFGASGYEDFTTHKDPERKARYLARHHKENWDDPETAGFWARHLLWNKDTIKDSIADLSKSRIKVTVKNVSL